VGEARAARDPLEAWFEGGPDVPLADLRDALRADGWDAASLRAWVAGRIARWVERALEAGSPEVRGRVETRAGRRTVVVPVR
jgi:hypothetical protein